MDGDNRISEGEIQTAVDTAKSLDSCVLLLETRFMEGVVSKDYHDLAMERINDMSMRLMCSIAHDFHLGNSIMKRAIELTDDIKRQVRAYEQRRKTKRTLKKK